MKNGGRKINIRMKHEITIISVIAGLFMWTMDAACFTKGSFMDAFILNVPMKELSFRILLTVIFISSGVLMSQMFSRKEAMQEQIVQAKKEWEETFDIINDAITIHDKDFNIIRANKAAEKMLGVPFQVLLSRKCYRSYHGTDYPPESCPSCKTLNTGVPSVTTTYEENLKKHVEIKALPRYDRDNTLIGVVHVVRDITDRMQAEEQLRSMSLKDDLTDLYNRRGFFTLAEQQKKVASRMKKGVFVLFADLDGLKEINDTYGHKEGCSTLMEAASILRECFRESDIIARLGGDEFVVFSMENEGNSDAGMISRRLQQRIELRNAQQRGRSRLSMSIGIAYCPQDKAYSLEDLIHRADALMYDQKKKRKGDRCCL
jgi:diguanylate cyclase (GGDEF)-like protein/PAS domain S-box-containing protein